MKKYIFTDLACEANGEKNDTKIRLTNRIERSELIRSAPNDFDDKSTQKNITYFTPRLWELSDDEFFILKDAVASDLRKLTEDTCKKRTNGKMSVLVVGMGNPYFCSDSLGVETAKKITATRNSDYGSEGVAVIIPDVTGNTGIETSDAVAAYSKIVKPDVIIIIDSLASRSSTRLAATIQISDDGLKPGSGIGKGSRKISAQDIGVPIISIGVPTVINSSTIIADAFERAGISNIEQNCLNLIMTDSRDTFVTPKESDLLVKTASLLLSAAIETALK